MIEVMLTMVVMPFLIIAAFVFLALVIYKYVIKRQVYDPYPLPGDLEAARLRCGITDFDRNANSSEGWQFPYVHVSCTCDHGGSYIG